MYKCGNYTDNLVFISKKQQALVYVQWILQRSDLSDFLFYQWIDVFSWNSQYGESSLHKQRMAS